MNTALKKVAVGAALITLTSAVVAGASDNPNTIHACASKVNGQLRIEGDPAGCKNNEIATSWNKDGPQGPKGDPGLPGPKGDKGDPGQPGPSEAVVATPSFTPFGSGFLSLASLTLPTTNKYVIHAKVTAANPDTANDDSLACKLQTPTAFHGVDQSTAPAPRSVSTGGGTILQSSTTVALLAPFAPTAGNQTVTLQCVAAFGRVHLYPSEVKLIAVRVATLL